MSPVYYNHKNVNVQTVMHSTTNKLNKISTEIEDCCQTKLMES